MSYAEVLNYILGTGGVRGLLFRGLSARILTNGLQSMIFTVFWRYFAEGKANHGKAQEAPVRAEGAPSDGVDGGGVGEVETRGR